MTKVAGEDPWEMGGVGGGRRL